MKTSFLIFCTFVLTIAFFLPAMPAWQVGVLRSHPVFAQESLYPISELGGCRDRQECFLYCEIPEHKPACWSYGTYRLPAVLGENQTNIETEIENIATDEFKAVESDIEKLEGQNNDSQHDENNVDDDQVMEEKAKKYSVIFPIAELDNCANYTACKSYCVVKEHYEACIAFAKKKGFYKNEAVDRMKAEYLARMKELTNKELGCDYATTCRDFCSKTENMDRCKAFIAKYAATVQPLQPVNKQGLTVIELLERAKTELGCDSLDSCRLVCEQNKDKCIAFSRKIGLYGGVNPSYPPQGPGQFSPNSAVKPIVTCENSEQCRKYCSEHPDRCPGFPRPYFTPGASYYPKPSGYPSYYPRPSYYPKPSYYPSLYPKPTYYYPSYYPRPTNYYAPSLGTTSPYPTHSYNGAYPTGSYTSPAYSTGN